MRTWFWPHACLTRKKLWDSRISFGTKSLPWFTTSFIANCSAIRNRGFGQYRMNALTKCLWWKGTWLLLLRCWCSLPRSGTTWLKSPRLTNRANMGRLSLNHLSQVSRYLAPYSRDFLMRILLERAKSIGEKIGLNDDKGYLVAIALALIIVSSLLAGYYLLYKPSPEGFSTIYLLDERNKAENYPQTLVSNQNSTFTLPVAVVNNM